MKRKVFIQDEKDLGDDDHDDDEVYGDGYGKLLKHNAKCHIKTEDQIFFYAFLSRDDDNTRRVN